MTQALHMSFFQDYGVYFTLSSSDIPKLSGITRDRQSFTLFIFKFLINVAFTAA